MVEGVLASLAADWYLTPGDLLRIRYLSVVEFPAHAAVRIIRDLRFRNRGCRCFVHVPVAGEHFSSDQDSRPRASGIVRITILVSSLSACEAIPDLCV